MQIDSGGHSPFKGVVATDTACAFYDVMMSVQELRSLPVMM